MFALFVFCVTLKSTLFIIRSFRVFALKKIPVSYRIDLFGWQLLDLIAFLAFFYFLWESNTQGILIIGGIYLYLIFKVSNECNRTILEGIAAKEAALASSGEGKSNS